MERKPLLIGKLLDVIPAFLALFVPIFFLPLTTEFFEFNKLALITVFTGFMLLLWVAKMLYDRKVEIARSVMDFPILAAFVVTLLATIFSLHKVSSIYGAQGRWFPSLFGAIVLFVLYYIVSTNISSIKTVKTVVSALILGITISTVVALLSYFGISLGSAPYMQIANFTLSGSTITVAVLAALGVSLSLTKLVSSASASKKLLFVGTLAFNFLLVALMGTFPSWAVLGVGLLVAAFFTNPIRWKENKSSLGMAGVIVTAILVLGILPFTREVLINDSYPAEITLSARESWLVVSSVIRDFPALGTGPSTFGLNYTRYKPLSVNGENYWNVSFDKPYSEAFNVIGSLGIVGIAVALAFTVKALKFVLGTKRQMENSSTNAALAVGLVSMMATMFVTYATVTTGFLFALFLALIVAKSRLEMTNGVSLVKISISSIAKGAGMSIVSGEKEVFQYVIALPLVALAVAAGYFGFRQYSGEYFMRQAIAAAQENNGSLTYRLQQKAISAFPRRDVYHNSYANTNLALANTLSSKEDLTEEERATAQALIAQAIRSTRVTTEVLNPLSAANWETRANIYRALIGVAGDAADWSIRSYNTAIQLDPASPRLRLNLGGIYYAAGDYLSAANLFNQSTSLKGDYANAHYNLAQALKLLDRPAQAKEELEVVKRLVEPGSPDYEIVAAELDAINLNPTVAGATDQPSVEDIAGPASEATVQEPIVNVGEEEILDSNTDIDLDADAVEPAPEQIEEVLEENN